MVEIPANTREILGGEVWDPSEEAYEGVLPALLLEQRRKQFSMELINIVQEEFMKQQGEDFDVRSNHDTMSFHG